MVERDECCGWASWGELVGMGDGSVTVDAWEQRGAGAGCAQSGRAGTEDAPKAEARMSGSDATRSSGRQALAALALSRWKLAERNRHG